MIITCLENTNTVNIQNKTVILEALNDYVLNGKFPKKLVARKLELMKLNIETQLKENNKLLKSANDELIKLKNNLTKVDTDITNKINTLRESLTSYT